MQFCNASPWVYLLLLCSDFHFPSSGFYFTNIAHVQEILGTANSVGCTVDGKKPRQLQAEIESGAFEIPSA